MILLKVHQGTVSGLHPHEFIRATAAVDVRRGGDGGATRQRERIIAVAQVSWRPVPRRGREMSPQVMRTWKRIAIMDKEIKEEMNENVKIR
jgi:hypothetical protein